MFTRVLFTETMREKKTFQTRHRNLDRNAQNKNIRTFTGNKIQNAAEKQAFNILRKRKTCVLHSANYCLISKDHARPRNHRRDGGKLPRPLQVVRDAAAGGGRTGQTATMTEEEEVQH